MNHVAFFQNQEPIHNQLNLKNFKNQYFIRMKRMFFFVLPPATCLAAKYRADAPVKNT